MKSEAADFLAKAGECLDAARKIIAIPLPEVAAKEAYLAAYHAAHAFVFEGTGQIVKSHSGMRTLFARLARDDVRVAPELGSLLARAYKFKEIADYGVGARGVVTAEEAREVLAIAERFIGAVAALLPPSCSGEG